MDKYYKILNLNQTASIDDIKNSYRMLSKKYHPDKHHGNDLEELASEKFREIKDAYDKIINYLKENKNKESNFENEYKNERDVFNLYGFEIKLSEELKLYNEIRREVNTSMDNYYLNYEKKYFSYRSLDNFLKKDLSYVENMLQSLVDEIIEVCLVNGYDMYSSQTFMKRTKSILFERYIDVYSQLEEKAYIIDNNKDYTNEVRKYNNNLKFRKNAFDHAGNIVKKASISIKASNSKNSFYKDEKIISLIFEIIHEMIESILDLVCNVIGIPNGENVLDKEKAMAIYENLNKYPKELFKEKICEGIMLYPYYSKLYVSALCKLGDPKNELGIIGKEFGVQVIEKKKIIIERVIENFKKNKLELREEVIKYGIFLHLDIEEYIIEIDNKIKKEKIEFIKKFYEDGNTKTEDSTLELKEKIINLGKEKEVDVLKYIDELDEKLVAFDLSYRTIKGTGIICETRKEIDNIYSLYKEKFEELEKILENNDKKLINLKNKLKEINEFDIEEKYKSKIINFLKNKEEETVNTYKKNVKVSKGGEVKCFLISFLCTAIFIKLFLYFGVGFFGIVMKIILGVCILGSISYPFLMIKERKNQRKELNELGIEY